MAPQTRRAPLFKQQAATPARWLPWTLTALAICLCIFTLLRAPPQRASQPNGAADSASGLRLGTAQRPTARGRTLVVYVFSGSDPEYADNLRFFIEQAVQVGAAAACRRRRSFAVCLRNCPALQPTNSCDSCPPTKQADDGCDYVIVLQQGTGLTQPDPLPPLPPNARYLRHPNECYDIGTVGWVLEQQLPAAVATYSYFIWLNSSVRGPFLPAYLRGRLHWTEPLLSKLGATVKLVGATINCGRAYDIPPTAHVQSYVSATDAAGLAVLLATRRVFRCWGHIHETIIESEIGASRAMLAAGYSIDCLMLRYQVRGAVQCSRVLAACTVGCLHRIDCFLLALGLDASQVAGAKCSCGFPALPSAPTMEL